MCVVYNHYATELRNRNVCVCGGGGGTGEGNAVKKKTIDLLTWLYFLSPPLRSQGEIKTTAAWDRHSV